MTVIDVAGFEAGRGGRISLAGVPDKVSAAGLGTTEQGFASFDRVFVEASAFLSRSTAGVAPGLTLLVEESDDGASWSTVTSFVFSASGSGRFEHGSPKDYMRCSWQSVAGVWSGVSVDVIPEEVDKHGCAVGGGSSSIVVRKFPFAYNTAGLSDGAALYTPTVCDLIMDAWIEIDTAWNGTTPLGDFGTGSSIGVLQALFGNVLGQLSVATTGACLDMTNADHVQGAIPGLLRGNQIGSLRDAYALYNLFNMFTTGADLSGNWGINDFPSDAGSLMGNGDRIPYKVTIADPIKVVVSQDGTFGGADPGASQGAAALYLVTATPR